MATFGAGNTPSPHSLSQTIATVAGQTYQFSFDYGDGQAGNQSLIASATGNTNLLTTAHIVTDLVSTSQIRYTFTFVADSSSTTITLTDTSDQSGLASGTSSVDGLIDNVSVRQLAGSMGTLNYTENSGAVAIHSSLNLSDFDSTNLVGATIQFSSGFNASQDLIGFTNQLGITGNYDPTTGVLTLTGTATVANYQTALRSITYANSSDSPTGSRTISFTVDDGSATSTLATRSIAISAVNDAPIAIADAATAVEAGGVANGTFGTNPSGNVLTNDTDVDAGDTKTVSGVAAGVVGSASTNVGSAVAGSFGSINIAADGSYTYTVDNNNATVQALRTTANTLTDVFTYTMRDTAGLTSTTQITFTIQGANDTPHDITGGSLSVNENASIGTSVGTATGQDVDANESFTYSLTNSAGGRFAIDNSGLITVANSTLLDREAFASHSITVRVMDASGASYDKIFSISLNDVDEFDVTAPTDTNATANAVNENASIGTVVGITASASDLDATNNTVTYSLFNNDGGRFAIHSSTGVVTVAGAIDREADGASRSITIRALSSDGSFSDQVFSISIGDIDEFNVGSITDTNLAANVVDEFAASGTTVAITALASDADATTNAIAYTLDNTAGGRFTINGSTGIVTVNDGTLLDAAQASSHVITVRATSADGSFSTQDFTINISNLNDAPTAVGDSATAVEAGGVSNGTAGSNPTGNVLTNDTDPDVGDTRNVIGVVAGTAVSASGSVGSNVAGSYGSITINSDGSYTYTVDNSNTSVQALRTSSNTLQDVFTYSMQDAGGLSSTTQVTITIQGRNDHPYDLTSTALAVDENAANGTVVGTITGLDVDSGDSRNYSLTDNSNGRFAINASTGEITVIDGSLLNFELTQSHNVTVRVTDTNGATYDEIFTVYLNDVNESPVAVNDSNTAVEAGGVSNGSAGSNPTGNALTNDTDIDAGDTKTVSGVVAGIAASASGSVGSSVAGNYGSLTLASNGSYVYTVDNSNSAVQALRTSGNTLQDVFTYTMVDSGGLTSTTQVTITIQGANDNPLANTDSATAIEANGYNNSVSGTNPTGNVLTNDTDVDSVIPRPYRESPQERQRAPAVPLVQALVAILDRLSSIRTARSATSSITTTRRCNPFGPAVIQSPMCLATP